MNEHPEPLLADYVDDALGPQDRARVEAHLRDCPSCREEVELASGARGALEELPEVAAPAGLTFEVRRRARRPGGGLGWKIATGAAAAAVAVVAIVVALRPGVIGDGGGGATAPAMEANREAIEDQAGGAQEGPAPEAAARDTATALRAAPTQPQYQETGQDYDAVSIVRFGKRLAGQTPASLRLGFRQPATDFYANFDLDRYPEAARRAVECLLREAPPDQIVVPYRIEAASFEGRPAYVGAFLQGGDEEEPYDRLLLWVVDRDGCSLRYFASFRLP